MTPERPRNSIENEPVELSVMPATREDMNSLIDIVGDPEDLEYMMRVQEQGKGKFFVAKVNEKVVGAGLLESDYQSKYKSEIKGNFLAGLIVSENYRRQGVGGKLMDVRENEVRESGGKNVMLAVNKNNDNAISLFEKRGYKKIPGSDYMVTDEGGEGGEGAGKLLYEKNAWGLRFEDFYFEEKRPQLIQFALI